MKKILKNKKIVTIVAMVLMVSLVIGMGSMTYSRYVSSANMDQPATATVADWGYVLKIDSTNIFGTKYEDNVVNEAFTETDSDKIDVLANATADIIAPGTSGSMTITVSGQSEVLAQFTLDVLDTTKDVILVYKETADGAEKTYNPVKWTLTEKVGDAEPTTLVNGLALNDITTALEAKSAKISAGTNVAETVYTLSWAWELGDLDSANNKLDTALGMYAANSANLQNIQDATNIIVVTGDNKTNIELKLSISASVVQIQD